MSATGIDADAIAPLVDGRWPQLEEIPGARVFGGEQPPSRLWFPSYRTGKERMLADVRKLLDRVTEHAGACRSPRRKAEVMEYRVDGYRDTLRAGLIG